RLRAAREQRRVVTSIIATVQVAIAHSSSADRARKKNFAMPAKGLGCKDNICKRETTRCRPFRLLVREPCVVCKHTNELTS
ncbi:unnamed protein product, partial [Amoebophrya sp. A120]